MSFPNVGRVSIVWLSLRLILLVAPSFLTENALGAELKGVVRAKSGETISVALEGDLVPAIGDKAEIFFKLAGVDEEVSVATGKVEKVEGDAVQVKVENATGVVEKGQLARIQSEKPQKGAFTAASSTPPPPASEASPAAVASPEPPAPGTSIVGRWADEKEPDRELVFRSDGRVVIPLPGEAAGITLTGTYKLDASTNPARLEISPLEFTPPPHFTDEEAEAMRQGIEQEASKDAEFAETLATPVLGEFDGTQIRLLAHRLKDGSVKQNAPDKKLTLKRVKPGEGAPFRAANTYQRAFEEGNARYNEHNYDAAIDAYTKAIEANPKDPNAFYNRALCRGQKRNFNQAIADLNRALDLDPKNTRAYQERVRNRISLEDWSTDLLEDCNKVLTAEPQNAEVLVYRGAYYLKVGAKEAAEADFKKAVSLDAALATRIEATKQALTAGKKQAPPGKKQKR